MAEPNTQTCPVCSIKIVVGVAGGDRVLFSTGPQGDRAKLWARVCQYVNRPGCINDKSRAGTIKPDDYYKPDAPQTSA
ncbi:MAG: hypothetical protein AAF215_08510 [Cyanobacteria bacterium P01_A01_bin.123]